MKRFTFAVMTYNQEDLILDLLESIRFQILHYGSEIKVSLFISDDASKDNTLEIANAWIEKYKDSFEKTVVVRSQENVGTVKNFARLMDMIVDDDYKLLAGDDLFSDRNVFDSLRGKNEIVAYTPYTVNVEGVDINPIWYARHLSKTGKRRAHSFFVKRQEIGGYFYTPCTFLHHSMYSLYYKGKESPFRLYEDDLFFHELLKKNPEGKVVFVNDDRVLYRIHSQGVSTSVSTQTHDAFMKEYFLYKKLMAKEEKNILVKIYLGFQSQNMKNKYFYIPNYVEKVSKLIRMLQLKYVMRYRLEYASAVKRKEELQDYYANIHERAVEFKKNYCQKGDKA